MKKLAIAIPVLLSLSLAGCLKDKPNVDFSTTNSQYIAEISTSSVNSTPNAPSGGLTYFAGATLNAALTSLDTVTFTVNIASDYPPTKDIPVTIGVNDAARTAYIADPTKVQFLAFPSTAYTLSATTGTVHAGKTLDTFTVVFDHSKIDPTLSYMLPLSITNASGAIISGNMSTIYFHVVGNPLAGTYSWDWTRWNAADSTSSANTGTFTGHSTSFVPVSATTIEVKSGYYIGPRYQLSFVNTSGTLSNFTVAFNADDVATMTTGGVTITDGPNIVTADLVNHVFYFEYTALTGSGPRYVIDRYYK